MDFNYNPGVVALSFLIASFASYVSLDLAKRVRSQDRSIARAWLICGSVAMGTGIWSMHFMGMLALSMPFEVGFSYITTALSWLAAVLASAIALSVASFSELTLRRLIGGSLAMGAGICVMHYTGMASLELAPGIQWDGLLVFASILIAVSASAAALLIFFRLRQLSGRKELQWQIFAALLMGAAICGMHYTGMAAASFSLDSVCLSADQLGGRSLGLLVTAASSILMSVTMFTSTLDARMQSKAEKLTASLKEANSELQQIAFRDALTGLPNRLLLDDRVAAAIDRCDHHHSSLSLLFIDLDGFKPINDSFGHRVGDEVLREIGRRLPTQLRVADTVARVGGDEFVVLLESCTEPAEIAQTAQRLIDAIRAPISGGEDAMYLSCSIGIAMYPSDGAARELMGHADAAMYAAKRAGGSSYAFFQPHMNAGVREQVELQRDLRFAIERDELELHYQPKLKATSLNLMGVEALVRWRHPVRGMLSPAVFIPVAERSGLISSLGNWVIGEACRQAAAWKAEGLKVNVAINLSVHQFRKGNLVQCIKDAIVRHDIEAQQLTFEITESAVMDDVDSTMKVFRDLTRLGVKLSIDDFGTGYSSLSYLRRLHIAELKIDSSFVKEIDSCADARAIVEAVIKLAHVLNLKVVAEGVENKAQCEVLTELGCDNFQGFLFAKPMPSDTMARWAIGENSSVSANPSLDVASILT